jgi:transcriptional regulator with XRE-family HTH domain
MSSSDLFIQSLSISPSEDGRGDLFMATVNPEFNTGTPVPLPIGSKRPASGVPSRMHRIATVRRQQGVSLRTASRQLQADVGTLKQQEDETQDLRLSEIYRWQQVLGVPIDELLVDAGSDLSRPILERARLVRIMKTVKALMEVAGSPAVQRLVENLEMQLVELMPELKEISAWHSVGQRRSLDDVGRIMERMIPSDSHPSLDGLWDS